MHQQKLDIGAIVFGLIILCGPLPVLAFYQWQGQTTDIELRGMYRIIGGAGLIQGDTNDDVFAGVGVIGRVIANIHIGEGFAVYLNALATHIPSSLSGQGTGDIPLFDIDRSDVFRWSSDDNTLLSDIDHLNIRWSYQRLDLILGRQAINLANTFYFTPNDLFTSFSAQTFFRVYKPGVDALRVEYRIGDLTQLSLFDVFGYSSESKRFNQTRNSVVGRLTTVFKDYELIFISGHLADRWIVGGAFNGEYFKWLGVRLEGHYALPESTEQNDYSEISVGFEHSFTNTLNVQAEIFYHGRGVKSLDSIDLESCSLENGCDFGGYLGKFYSALGASYTLTTLLTGRGFLLHNWDDRSNIFGLNLVYSLSNEAELTVGMLVPNGRHSADTDGINSEFGLVPYSANIEIRHYF